jgi:hypothetical protein
MIWHLSCLYLSVFLNAMNKQREDKENENLNAFSADKLLIGFFCDRARQN